jgi:hypothetical protein
MPRSRLMTRSPWHNPAMVPDEQLQLSLRAGERLLWRGGPDPRKWYRSVEVTTSVFGVFWLGIVASAAVAGLRDGRSVFDLIPVVMLVLGFRLFAWRYVVEYSRRRRTAYGITDQRAIRVILPGPVWDRPGGLADASLQRTSVNVSYSRDEKHATVVVGDTFAMIDVPAPNAMLAALEQARAPQLG